MKVFTLEPDSSSPLGLRPEVRERCCYGSGWTLAFVDPATGEKCEMELGEVTWEFPTPPTTPPHD